MYGRCRNCSHADNSKSPTWGVINFDRHTILTRKRSGITRHKRSIPTANRKMKVLFYIAVVVFSFELAHSQVNSRSIIVFQVVDGKFIMAADSREVLNGEPSDSHCKIAAFSNQLLFGIAGVPSVTSVPPDVSHDWDAMKELNKIINTTTFIGTVDSATKVTTIADKWADVLKVDWSLLNAIHPELVEDVARHQHGNLTNGIFAVRVGNQVALAVRSIVLSNAVPKTDVPMVSGAG